MDNYYNKELFKHTLGFDGYSTNLSYNDTWSYINVDLSKLHYLKKLEEITIPEIIASDLKELKSIEIQISKIDNKIDGICKNLEISKP